MFMNDGVFSIVMQLRMALNFKIIIFIYVSVCVFVHICEGTSGGRKGVSGVLEWSYRHL